MSEQQSLLDRAAEFVRTGILCDPSCYTFEGKEIVGELIKAIGLLRDDIVTYENYFQTRAWTDHLGIGMWALEQVQDWIDEIFGKRKPQ